MDPNPQAELAVCRLLARRYAAGMPAPDVLVALDELGLTGVAQDMADRGRTRNQKGQFA